MHSWWIHQDFTTNIVFTKKLKQDKHAQWMLVIIDLPLTKTIQIL